jgi:hypothetical protein
MINVGDELMSPGLERRVRGAQPATARIDKAMYVSLTLTSLSSG